MAFLLTVAGKRPAAFPTVAATNTSNEAASTAQTVALPSGIQAGDLLLILVLFSSGPAITTPTGWTEIYKSVTGGSVSHAAYYKVAAGDEGSSVDITIDAARAGAHNSYRITGYSGAPQALANDASIDPPALTPVGGSKKYLWIALAGDHNGTAVTAAPTDYTNLLADVSGTTCLGSARRLREATSEDPGAFTATTSEIPRSATIAISPA